MNWEALKSFFTSKLVLQLRADLEEARHERDYFRGKVDRLEMVLMRLPEPVPMRKAVPANVEPVGRKSWTQVQEEWLAEQRMKATDEQKRKAEVVAEHRKES